MKATPQEQQELLSLADTDEEIRLLEHRKSNLPEQKILDDHVDIHRMVGDELLQAMQTKERLEGQQSRHESSIDEVDSSRKAHETRIYSGAIHNERELEALRHEIDALFGRKNDLEDSLLEIMEQLEEVTSLVDELTRRRAELTEQITDLTGRRDHAAADIDAELASVRERRATQVSALSEGVLSAYDSLRAKRPGRGVVARLDKRTCTGCQLELTAIELEEIKHEAAHSLAYCQQCGSIIVIA